MVKKKDLFRLENAAIESEIRSLLLSASNKIHNDEGANTKDPLSGEDTSTASTSTDTQGGTVIIETDCVKIEVDNDVPDSSMQAPSNSTGEIIFNPDYISMYCNDDIKPVVIKEENDVPSKEEINCDCCSKVIVGFRYSCIQCSKYDICIACETTGVHEHHYVLRVPPYRPDSEIKIVLEKIRNFLITELDIKVIIDVNEREKWRKWQPQSYLMELSVTEPAPHVPLRPTISYESDESCHDSNVPVPSGISVPLLVPIAASDPTGNSMEVDADGENCKILENNSNSNGEPNLSALRRWRRNPKYRHMLSKSKQSQTEKKRDKLTNGDQTAEAPSETSDKTNRPKKPHIKKPLNAFMIYLAETREKMKKDKNVNMGNASTINKVVGLRWQLMSAEERNKYFDRARIEKQRHRMLYPDYVPTYTAKGARRRNRPGAVSGRVLKRCRAVYGCESRDLWCSPCRRKKKCVRFIARTSTTGTNNSVQQTESQTKKPKQDKNKTDVSKTVSDDVDMGMISDDVIKIEIMSDDDEDDNVSLSVIKSSSNEVIRSAVTSIISSAVTHADSICNPNSSVDPDQNSICPSENCIDPVVDSVSRAVTSVEPALISISNPVNDFTNSDNGSIHPAENNISSAVISVDPAINSVSDPFNNFAYSNNGSIVNWISTTVISDDPAINSVSDPVTKFSNSDSGSINPVVNSITESDIPVDQVMKAVDSCSNKIETCSPSYSGLVIGSVDAAKDSADLVINSITNPATESADSNNRSIRRTISPTVITVDSVISPTIDTMSESGVYSEINRATDSIKPIIVSEKISSSDLSEFTISPIVVTSIDPINSDADIHSTNDDIKPVVECSDNSPTSVDSC